MSALAERIVQDLKKIEDLSRSLNGKVKIKSKSGTPTNQIVLELAYPTAPSREYPAKVRTVSEVRLDLLSRYPFQEPTATMLAPVFHPNVYSSGRICLGAKWMPTQGLDLLVKRIIKIITFDESILNESSPANAEALSWYRSAIKSNPNAFPTEKLVMAERQEKKISWSNSTESPELKVVVSCAKCGGGLRVPKGRRLNVSCPKCAAQFVVET